MPDLTEVMEKMAEIVVDAVYPNGTSQPSVSGKHTQVMLGWPRADVLEQDLADNKVKVTIYAPEQTAQPQADQYWGEEYTFQAPVHGMTPSVLDNTATWTGTPTLKEYATLIIGGDAYSIVATTGESTVSLISRLLVDIQTAPLLSNGVERQAWPDATRDGTSITVPLSPALEARVGAPGIINEALHRQSQTIFVSIWAPDEPSRTATGKAIDLAFKRDRTIIMPDQSMMMFTYIRTAVTDEDQNKRLFKRDLVLAVEFATIDGYEAFEVTSVNPPVSQLAP